MGQIKSERSLRNMIERNLRKEIHDYTKPSIDFIYKILEDAYNRDDFSYNVEDMRSSIIAFAAHSHNQSDYCLRLVTKMKFRSDEPVVPGEYADDAPLVVYDSEVFPNLYLVCYKQLDTKDYKYPVISMINPSPSDIEELLKKRLISFNGKAYDSQLLYARFIGYNNSEIYKLSQRLINTPKSEAWKVQFSEAKNLEYVDIYDFSAVKQSLKKWEIDLHIHHQENEFPWDEPLPEKYWEELIGYCKSDTLATEYLFNHLQGDFIAREILADIAGMPVNTSTNKLVEQILFQGVKKPQLLYTDLRNGEQWTEERKWYLELG